MFKVTEYAALKVCDVDKFFKSSSREFHSLLKDEIHDFVRYKVSKGAKIRNQYNQVPHLTQDTNRKVTNSQLDTIHEIKEDSLLPAGDHKAHINSLAQRHNKHKTEKT